jgi:hypothetical protein
MLELIQVPPIYEDQNNPEYLRNLNDYLQITKNYQKETLGSNYKKESSGSEFIGGMPVTLENNCFKQLYRTINKVFVYNLTLKVDGERYLLFLNSWGELYFIDRLLNFYFFQQDSVRLPRINLKPFLLDGELVQHKSTKEFEFFIFDVLFYEGNSFIEKDYYTRYDIIMSILTIFSGYPSELIVSGKKWFPLTDLLKTNDIYSYITENTNQGRLKKFHLKADGLILQPFDTPYVTSGPWNKYNNILFKWKPVNEQTMDFKIKIINNNNWQLLTRSDYPFTMPGSGEPASYTPTDANKREFVDSDVAEFSYNNGKFKLVRSRPNKLANSKDSIMSVFNFIYNPFTLDYITPIIRSMTINPNLKNILFGYSTSDLILCALKDNLIFSKNEINGIKDIYNLLRSDPKDTELEFRILKKGKKDSNVDKSIFNYLLEYLSLNYPLTESFTIDTSPQKVDRFEPTLRSTYKSFDDLFAGKSVLNETKQQIKLYFSEPSKIFNLQFKVSLSHEKKTSNVIRIEYIRNGIKSNNNIRMKKRYSFQIGSLWRIDATIVKSGFSIKEVQSKNDTYEIECEFIGDISKVSFDSFLRSFNSIYILIIQNSNYC